MQPCVTIARYNRCAWNTWSTPYMKPMEHEIPPSPGQRATAALISSLNAPASAKAVMFGLMQIKGGVLTATLPDGRTLQFGEGPAYVDLTVRDWRFARRVLSNGDIGFAEGFMAREWETTIFPRCSRCWLITSNASRG